MPRLASVSPLSLVAVLAALATSACSSGGGGAGGGAGSGGAPSDGKVHPAGNGQRESQTDACDALSQAQSARVTALSCIATTQPCPDLIVAMGGQSCLQYDQGSVEGCAAYYAQQTTCAALTAAFADCEVTAFAGSAPTGCP